MARIGLTLPRSEDLPRKEIVEVVQEAESLGYESVWVGESWGRDGFTWPNWSTTAPLASHCPLCPLRTGRPAT
jgi:alkanesulfonate monooxygenase SsuD/methylene tetrahydromethanopterin reductase-like flavin-dependent oxidoreductase (luciferase family)